MMKPNIRLLIVEDETLVARDLQLMVERAGYEVCGIATTAQEALNLAFTLKPDLALVDIVIKGSIDGIEIAQKIWQEMEIPVIYVTAYADESTLNRARETTPFGYLLKPFDERELHINIEMALFKSQLELKLKERENFLATILKTIKEAVITTNKDNLITYFNPSAEKLTGWRAAEALAQPVDKIINLIDSSNYQEAPLFSSGWLFLKTKKGELIPVEYNSSPLKPKPSFTEGEVIVIHDINERYRSQQELFQSWQKLQQAFEGTIQALALTIEIRDPYTAGHQRRVSELATAIAKELSWPAEQIKAISIAGDIHDIGKISIPAEILSKPAKLSEVEYSLIKTHPQVGYEILKNVDFPWPIAQIVLQHHERLDGSGYPAGLSGDSILPEAKILAVADTVEAMASHRPYRPALGIDRALAEILKYKGILYDAEAVDVCLSLFRRQLFKWS
ncbi:MAG: response regulator [Candidatus Aminicenantes bacterium]|nr:response regulator [Candidatus Aminicenantes bacterium]